MRSRALVALLRVAGVVFRLVRFRGSTRVWSRVVRHIDPSARCVVRLSPRSVLEIYLDDLRWSYLLFPGFHYEPSVAHCLRLFEEQDCMFLDGGANVGYWSVLASENSRHKVIAVEPVAETFEKLRRNCEHNSFRFACVHAALRARSGEREVMAVHPVRHGSSYVVEPDAAIESGRFPQPIFSVTVDELLGEHDPSRRRPVILKLDVEGSEVQALRGATATIASQSLVIYEDHGRDDTDTVSRFLFEELQLRGYFIDDVGRVSQLGDLNAVRKRKRTRVEGFNFFATREGSIFDRVFAGRCRHD